MITRTTVAAIAAAALAAGTAATAAASHQALVKCGKPLTAGGKSWQVEAAAVPCGTARGIVSRVATAKPDQVLHAQGGEIDRFKRTFSGLACFRSGKKGVGYEIQCTSANGSKSVLAVSRP